MVHFNFKEIAYPFHRENKRYNYLITKKAILVILMEILFSDKKKKICVEIACMIIYY